MTTYAAVAAAYFVVGLPMLVLIGLTFSVRRLLENRRANRLYRACLAAAAPDQLECRGGPLDGECHDRVSDHWQCVEYPDSRGFAAVTDKTALYLHRSGAVRWPGVYYSNGDHFAWHPHRSRWLNTLVRRAEA